MVATKEIGKIRYVGPILKEATILPEEYQEVEYIGGDGTAHINTGLIANTITEINIKLSDIYQGNSYADSYSYIVFGTTVSSWWYSSTYYTNGGSRFRYHSGDGTRKYYDCNAAQTGVEHIIRYLPSTMLVDGTSASYVATDNSWPDASVGEVCLWYCGNNSRSKYKLYNCVITSGGHEYRFVPCYRKSDDVLGLYCLYNNTFYTNANSSGTFSAGPEVHYPRTVPGMGEVEITKAYKGTQLVYQNKVPVDETFTYTGTDQYWTSPSKQCYIIEAWGAGSNNTKGGYACGLMELNKNQKFTIVVGQTGNGLNACTYGFGGASNYGGRSGGGLSGVFTGDAAVTNTSSDRAVVIGGGGGGGRSGTGHGGGETGCNGGGGNYGTAGAGGTQTGRGSGGNGGSGQFGGGNGSGTYGFGGGGGWWGGNGSAGDGSGDDDRDAGGGSGYVIASAIERCFIGAGGKNAGECGCIHIKSVDV